ncbi:P-loop NTPase [Fusobacterium mortiferum]|uniref:ATPase n=1 Tax=Fusobacterium mortiferum ATCC 9817 TaxID=469616 RepID=A0ABN5J889_FUSMR|nr:ATP-binding protein [Fusobacterium mortiferum]AVQ18712.1 ATPase [Fusobacterium mortiferum ATCC 9817]EEO34955.1 CobQ/CobB/MinD/ParA nucleotide binding domain protein [Fusobacterium mortiferum ATCC 9817]
MKIAVLSGKGGTGKTTVSTSLAFISGIPILDMDIEAPNTQLFLKGKKFKENKVKSCYPEVDMSKCNLCGECGKFCRFNAIIPAKNRVIVFEESCHDCGGCEIICKFGAITWRAREIGKIFCGKTYFNSKMEYGKLNIGEMSGVKIIKHMYRENIEKNLIIDCPPGTSCTTVAAVEKSDYAIVVTEPSPFGLSDMKLVLKLLRDLKIPFGIVINKADSKENLVENYYQEEGIEILEKIPFDRKIAKNYSEGNIIADILPEYRKSFEKILKRVQKYGD